MAMYASIIGNFPITISIIQLGTLNIINPLESPAIDFNRDNTRIIVSNSGINSETLVKVTNVSPETISIEDLESIIETCSGKAIIAGNPSVSGKLPAGGLIQLKLQ